MSARAELELSLKEIVGKGLRQDAYYPVVAPRTPEEAAQVIRAARDHQFNVLVLGNESSRPPQLSALRDNILVILNVWLTGIERLSPFSVRVLGGTPVASVVHGGSEPPRKTVGGLICSASVSSHEVTLRALWSRVRCAEVITANGEIQRFAATSAVSMEDPATANLLIGSRGRLGMVAAVELMKPIPIAVQDSKEREKSNHVGRDETLFSQTDAQMLLDPHGLFQW